MNPYKEALEKIWAALEAEERTASANASELVPGSPARHYCNGRSVGFREARNIVARLRPIENINEGNSNAG